jgi:hypothetical protein
MVGNALTDGRCSDVDWDETIRPQAAMTAVACLQPRRVGALRW